MVQKSAGIAKRGIAMVSQSMAVLGAGKAKHG
jgi:hypothetical protein